MSLGPGYLMVAFGSGAAGAPMSGVPSSKQKFRERSVYVRLQVGQRFILSWLVLGLRAKAKGRRPKTNSGKDYRNLHFRSSCNRLSTASTEFGSGGIAVAALPAEYLDWFGRTPVKRCSSDGNAASPAKSGVWWISMPAAWTRDSAGRWSGG